MYCVSVCVCSSSSSIVGVWLRFFVDYVVVFCSSSLSSCLDVGECCLFVGFAYAQLCFALPKPPKLVCTQWCKYTPHVLCYTQAPHAGCGQRGHVDDIYIYKGSARVSLWLSVFVSLCSKLSERAGRRWRRGGVCG